MAPRGRAAPRGASRERHPSFDRLRTIAIVLLAAAAALSVLGAKTGERWLTGLSFALFVAAVGVLSRLRGKRG